MIAFSNIIFWFTCIFIGGLTLFYIVLLVFNVFIPWYNRRYKK